MIALFKNKTTYIKSYFTKGHERSINVKKNILLSFAIKGLNIFIGLLLVPLTINYVDKTQYGIWLTLSSIIAWFGFFDIGFGNGLRNKFAEAITHGKHKLARIYVSTTYSILAMLIGLVLVLFLCANPFLNWASILNTNQSTAPQLSILALIVFVFFCVQFVLQLITVVVTANQQPAKAALLNFFGNLLTLAIIYILTKSTSGNLIYLGITLGLTPVLVLLVSSIWFYSRDYKLYAPAFKYVRLRFAKNLMDLGLKFFVIQIAVIILYQTSNIIITQLYSPSEVTPYNIVYKYFSIIPMIFGIIISPLWSAFTAAWANQDIEWVSRTIKKLKLVWVALSTMTIFMVIGANYIYKFWVGADILISFNLSLTMAIYVIINIWNSIYSQFLNGVGKIKLQLVLAIGGSLINIPLSLFLCKTIGNYGVILSTIIISLPGLIIYPIQYKKIIQQKAQGIWAS